MTLKYIIIGSLIFLTTACSKTKTNVDNSPTLPLTTAEIAAKEYGIDINGVRELKKIEFLDDTTKLLLIGEKGRKLWLSIGDKQTKKMIFNWVDNYFLDTVLVLNPGYGQSPKVYTLKNSFLNSVYNNGNMSFVLLRGDELGQGTQHSYFFKKLTFTNRLTLQQLKSHINDWGINKPVIWYNGSVLYKDKDGKQNFYDVYDNDGAVVTSFNYDDKNDLEPYSGKVVPIDYDEVIQLADPFFRRWNYKTEKEFWVTKKSIKEQISNTIRIDSWKANRNGDILTVTCYYTLFSGEKGNYSYTINITTGEVTKI